MTTYVLVMLLWGPVSGVSHSIEFNSLKACRAAEQVFLESNEFHNHINYKVIFCTPK